MSIDIGYNMFSKNHFNMILATRCTIWSQDWPHQLNTIILNIIVQKAKNIGITSLYEIPKVCSTNIRLHKYNCT